MVVMGLVVFVPVITRLDAVEVPWLTRAILVVPPVGLPHKIQPHTYNDKSTRHRGIVYHDE